MTVKLVVLYTQPDDPDAFDEHYLGVHGPLVEKIPGLLRWEGARFTRAGRRRRADVPPDRRALVRGPESMRARRSRPTRVRRRRRDYRTDRAARAHGCSSRPSTEPFETGLLRSALLVPRLLAAGASLGRTGSGRRALVALQVDQDPGDAGVGAACRGSRADRSGGSSTSEKFGLMSMRPKSARFRPPSLARAPTIWRGSTRCRLPTEMRHRHQAAGEPRDARAARWCAARASPRGSSGSPSCASTAIAAAMSAAGTSCSCS